MVSELSVSHSGLRISYDRLLSDLVPGAALLWVLAHSPLGGMLGVLTELGSLLRQRGTAEALLLALMGAIAALGLGILGNAISWFLLGWLTTALEDLQAKQKIGGASARLAGLSLGKVGKDCPEWYATMGVLRTWLSVHRPELLERVAYMTGGARMARSRAAISFLDAALWAIDAKLMGRPLGLRPLTTGLAGALLLVLSFLMSWHFHLQLLGMVRHLDRRCLPEEVQSLLENCRRAPV